MLCDKFAEKSLSNSHFCEWFSLREGRQGIRRGGELYLEKTAQTERLNNSPLFFFRLHLNGTAEKSMGNGTEITEISEEDKTDCFYYFDHLLLHEVMFVFFILELILY